ncbi:hypothetical protein CAPTEDRAFT_168302 [Capitella teleta]|uniref:Uncharacterized protein n=1 Tax=Capitella teleta TaxID=283909 RepID=R7U2J8_CAPTE|nr:hypothetical protein CAPTEDRAFT_168302 [Capitella teleta]|eukprot:ELU00108.1 hypothetical protein CAPTEDRAFT_168302 [Capitella teleta]
MTFTFDTHALVKKFQACGFTERQSEELVNGLCEISQEGLDHTGRNMVTKPQQEIMVQQIHTHLSALKKDMVILEKSEFSQLRHEYEKQNIELRQLRKQLDDDIMKLKAGVTLDLNLEKSRSVESHQDSLREIQQLMNKLDIQKSETARSLAGLDNKISREVSNLIATYERYRNDVMKYAAGTVLSCLTICLGFYRIWKP